MASVLKKGLKLLKKCVASHKDQLKADLKAGNFISAVDEEWLVGVGNLIDEERVVEVLDNESDYEKGLELDIKDRDCAGINFPGWWRKKKHPARRVNVLFFFQTSGVL